LAKRRAFLSHHARSARRNRNGRARTSFAGGKYRVASQHTEWGANRIRFNVDLRQPGSEAQAEKWQKLYHRGVMPDGEAVGTPDHRTRLKVRPFKKPAAG
jgi:hypothetical protein